MIDLPIGTRFYFGDRLIEVVESKFIEKCLGCVFKNKFLKDGYDDTDVEICYAVECGKDERKDKKDVTFKEVKECVN